MNFDILLVSAGEVMTQLWELNTSRTAFEIHRKRFCCGIGFTQRLGPSQEYPKNLEHRET